MNQQATAKKIIMFVKFQRIRKVLCGLRTTITENEAYDFSRALVNITTLCYTSPKSNGNGKNWLKILQNAEKQGKLSVRPLIIRLFSLWTLAAAPHNINHHIMADY
jgi:hypothetical protein